VPPYQLVAIHQACSVYVPALDVHIELKFSHRFAFAPVLTIVVLMIAPNSAVR